MASLRGKLTKDTGPKSSASKASVKRVSDRNKEDREKNRKKFEGRGDKQKQLALEKGGRFREGSDITTVRGETSSQKKQGQHFQLNFNERLGFSDDAQTAQVITRRVGEGGTPSASAAISQVRQETKQKPQGQQLTVTLEERLGLKTPETRKGAVSPFGGALSLGAEVAIDQQKHFKDFGELTGAAAKEASDLFFRPFTNTPAAISDAFTGEETTKPTALDDLFDATQKQFAPEFKDLASSLGFGEKATIIDRKEAAKAFPDFLEKQDKQIKKNFKEFIIPLGGEVIFNALPTVAAKAGASLFVKAGGDKLLKEGAELLRGVKPPKQIINLLAPKQKTIFETEKILGGKGLTPTRIKEENIGGGAIKLEALTGKQDKLVLLDPKAGKFTTIEGFKKTAQTPQSFRVQGPLGDTPKQQAAIQKKFGLGQINKDLFETIGKSDPAFKKGKADPKAFANLEKALKSEGISLTPAATIKEFTTGQVKKNPKEFGRFFFGKEAAPSKAANEFTLARTAGFGTVPSKIKKPRDVFGAKVFKPFKEKDIGITTEKPVTGRNIFFTKQTKETFKTKRPTTSFVSDVQKNIRFTDPFGKRTKGPFGKAKSFTKGEFALKDFGTTKGGAGSRNILDTTTKKGRADIAKSFVGPKTKSEMDILFKGPRFAASASGPSLKGSLQSVFSSTTPESLKGGDQRGPTKLKLSGGPKLGFKDEISLVVGKNNNRIKQRDLLGGSLIFKDELSLVTGTKQGTRQTETFNITDMLTTKLGKSQRDKEKFRFSDDLDLKLTHGGGFPPGIPPPPPPPVRPPRIPTGDFGIPASFEAFTGGRGKRSRKVFTAFGISSDIRIKNLPTFQRVGRSPKVFSALDKEDKKVQDAIFGKPRSKKSKRKKKKR